MNSTLPRWLHAAAFAAGLTALIPQTGYSQAVTPPGQTRKPVTVSSTQEIAAQRSGMDLATRQAAAGNITAAEAILAGLSKAKPNSAIWHVETAQRLRQVADRLARDAKPANVSALANLALQHLARAEPLATDARMRAAAKAQAGLIHERYLANRPAALAAYQDAAALAPTDAKSKEAVARLQATDANLRTKLPGGGR